ncbi:MAG: OB-fold nucleic acid binding domain-containing protein, partial [Anaerovoracaceae bacterium]
DGMPVVMTGMINSRRTLITKNSKMMAFLQLEDLYGVTEIVVFPNVYERCAAFTEVDQVIAVRGTLNFKEEEAPKVLADEILPLEEAAERGFSQRGSQRGSQRSVQSSGQRNAQSTAQSTTQSSGPRETQQPAEQPEGLVKVKLTAKMNREITLEQVKSVLKRHPGKAQVLIYLPEGKTLRTDRQLWVKPDQNLGNQLMAILGKENVKLTE